MREPDSTEKEEEGDQPRSEVEDWSESEMTPDALASYRACLFYQAQQERFEINETPRKRKAVDSASSSEYEGADFGEHHTVARGKGPMAMVMATTRPRKRMNMSQSPRMGRLGQNLHLPVRVFARGVAVEVPFGLCVDKIDPLTIEVRPVKDSIVSTTALCHNCRCNSTGLNRRAQCDNVTIGNSTRRCNKTFCERCLRGWYGLDDDAIEFVMRVQRAGEGRERTETCTGTGVGMGIVEGKWICPFCIDLCMCTHCYRRRGVERTKYAPSARAVISGNAVEQRVRATSSPVIRQRGEFDRFTFPPLYFFPFLYVLSFSLLTVPCSDPGEPGCSRFFDLCEGGGSCDLPTAQFPCGACTLATLGPDTHSGFGSHLLPSHATMHAGFPHWSAPTHGCKSRANSVSPTSRAGK